MKSLKPFSHSDSDLDPAKKDSFSIKKTGSATPDTIHCIQVHHTRTYILHVLYNVQY